MIHDEIADVRTQVLQTLATVTLPPTTLGPPLERSVMDDALTRLSSVCFIILPAKRALTSCRYCRTPRCKHHQLASI
jgi:hypothetical protein